MEEHIAKILSVDPVTHDVRRFKIEKPTNYSFIPGQATEVAVNKSGWENERHPFTFTGLNDWDHLEFTIKIYPERKGVTDQLGQLKAGDELLIHDVWGAIQYKGEGTFIAGGAGITPFIAIFRQLQKDKQLGNNKIIFSNKTHRDIILKDEFAAMLGKNFINTLTQENFSGYDHRYIDKDYLKEKISDFSQQFYICGPDPMVKAIQDILQDMGGKAITVEI